MVIEPVQGEFMAFPKSSAALIALGFLSVSVQAAAPVTGRWTTQSKDGVVEI